MSDPEIIVTIRRLITVFNELGILYQIGGSVASSVFGVARSTLDVDLVARITDQQVSSLVSKLEDEYYISESAVREAVVNAKSFNIVHLETMLKADVFILKSRPYDYQAFERLHADTLDPDNPSTSYNLCTPEDIVLNKLEWYRLGGETSERQWGDVIGVLKVQGSVLDIKYCRRWAKELGVDDLFEKALDETTPFTRR